MMAAPDAWSVRGPGGGGSLYSPSINPHEADEIYIASDMGQIFHTESEGAQWSTLDFRSIQGGPDAPVRFTSDPNLRYAIDRTQIFGDEAGTPVKSLDGGQTWQPLGADPTNHEAFNLLVDYHNPNRVILAGWRNLYFSNDGGATFSQKYVSPNSGAGLHASGAHFNGANIYVGTRDGLLVSTNGGASFQLASVGGIPSDERIVSFSGATEGGVTRLWAVTMDQGDVYGGVQGWDHYGYRGVYSLDVGQANWQRTTTGIATGAHPFFVASAINDIDTVYVAGGSTWSDPTVFKSVTGGQTWQNVLLTDNNQNVETGWSGDGGVRGWSYGENALGFGVNPLDANDAVITDYGFAHYTDDGGALWSVLNVAPADRNPVGSSIPDDKSYRSSGLENTSIWGVTWTDPLNLIGAYSDIRGAVSDDGGVSWSFDYTGHTQNSMYRAIVHPTSGVVYAATATVHDMYQSTHLTDSSIDNGGGRVLYSTDDGHTWQTLHDFGRVVTWVEADPNQPNRLYASVAHSTQGGIYVSNDIQNGAASTWTKLANPPRTQGHAFNLRVLDDGTLVASYSGRRTSSGFTASSGVFVSTDGGQSWQDRSAPGMHYWTKDVVIDPHDASQNTWYTSVFSGWGGAPNGLGGLYKTTDRGQTWERILVLDRVNSVTISPVNANEAYVTTETEGLWHTENLNAADPVFEEVTSYPFSQPMRVFYNPYDPNEVWVSSFGNSLMVGYEDPDAEPVSVFQFSAASYTADEGAGQATITVTRSGGAGAASVAYSTSSGSANDGLDYEAVSGVLAFADGEMVKTFAVPLIDDSFVEGDETLQLALSDPSDGGQLGAISSATLTIEDNDEVFPGSLAFLTAGFEADEGAGTATITVVRTGGADGVVSVNYSTAAGTAAAGADFTPVSGVLTFADGETSKTFTVPILDDSLVEGDETLQLTLSAPTGGADLGAISTATLTIEDNDVLHPGSLAFLTGNVQVDEAAGTAVITVVRTGGADGQVSVNYAATPGTASPGADYTPVSGVLIFADGETEKTLTVPILNDTADEPNETVVLTLSNPGGGAALGSPATATLTIVDNDLPSQPPASSELNFHSSTYTTQENWGYRALYIERTGDRSTSATVNYQVIGGTATSGVDYKVFEGTVTFAPGQKSHEVRLHLINDDLVEPAENVRVALTNPVSAALGARAETTVTINDDEVNAPGVLQLSKAVYNTRENWGYVEVYIERTNGLVGEVTVNYETENGTAIAGQDFKAASGTVTFASGQRYAYFRVYLLNDKIAEGTESLRVRLTDTTGGALLGARTEADVVIADDD